MSKNKPTLSLTVGRSCGSCTACCTVPAIVDPELVKPPGQTCPNAGKCSSGGGCGIYATRPVTCRSYTCSWLEGIGGDDDRPDRMGIILDTMFLPECGPFFKATEAQPQASRRDRAQRLIAAIARGVPVMVFSTDLSVHTAGDPKRAKLVERTYIAAVLAEAEADPVAFDVRP